MRLHGVILVALACAERARGWTSIAPARSGVKRLRMSIGNDERENPVESSLSKQEPQAIAVALPMDRRSAIASAVTAAAGLICLKVGGIAAGPAVQPGYDLRLERIYDTRIKSYLPARPEQLFRPGSLPLSPIVCLGEYHTHPISHYAQYHTIAALHKADPDTPLAIGLEMFYKTQQPALDRYVFDHGDLGTLQRETAWERTWGYDFNLYSKIFRYARVNGIRLVGLNVPQALVNLIAQRGLEGLPPPLRNALPELNLDVESHKNRFLSTMKSMESVHGAMPAAALARFYEAQTLWEEQMAECVVNYIGKFGGRMVVLAGVAHIANRDGIPDRITRRNGLSPFTIVPQTVEWDLNTGLPDVSTPPGPDTADWVWFHEEEIQV